VQYTKTEKKLAIIISQAFANLQATYERSGLGLEALQLNPSLVAKIVQKVEKDIEYMAKYHDISPNPHKEAGILTYWICKKKPIHIVDMNAVYKSLGRVAYVVDELLAVRCSIMIMKAANKQTLIEETRAAAGRGEEVHPHHKRVLDIAQMRLSLADFLHNLENGNLTSLSLAMQYCYIDMSASNETYLDYINKVKATV